MENFEARVVFLDTFFSEVFIVTLALATVSDLGSDKMGGVRMYDWSSYNSSFFKSFKPYPSFFTRYTDCSFKTQIYIVTVLSI